MTEQEIRKAWEDFMAFAKVVADPGVLEGYIQDLTLVEHFTDIMKSFGYSLSDEDVHVALGRWTR